MIRVLVLTLLVGCWTGATPRPAPDPAARTPKARQHVTRGVDCGRELEALAVAIEGMYQRPDPGCEYGEDDSYWFCLHMAGIGRTDDLERSAYWVVEACRPEVP